MILQKDHRCMKADLSPVDNQPPIYALGTTPDRDPS